MKHSLLIWSSLLALGASAASGALVVGDGALVGGSAIDGEYTASSVLNTQNPNTLNASGAWDADTGSFGEFRVAGSGLSYSGLTSEGGAFNYIRTNTAGGSVNKDALRVYSTSTAVAVNGGPDLWASALIQFSSDIERAFVGFSVVRGQDGTTARDAFGFGFQNGAAFLGSAGSLGSITSGSTAGNYAADTTHMVLLQAVGGSTDTLNLWVNPDVSLGEAGLGAPTVTASYSIFNDGLFISELGLVASTANSAGAGASAIFDEIKAGTTFADVVAIPEPSTYAALAGLGALALAMLRRRKQK